MCDFHNFGLIFAGQMYCLPQRLKSMASGVKKKFQTTLILIFEVILQPPKPHFLTFSSEIKIMKITHSVVPNHVITMVFLVGQCNKITHILNVIFQKMKLPYILFSKLV